MKVEFIPADDTPGHREPAALIINGQRWDASGRVIDATAATENASAVVTVVQTARDLAAALKWFIDDIDGTHTVMVDFDSNVERARAALLQAEVL